LLQSRLLLNPTQALMPLHLWSKRCFTMVMSVIPFLGSLLIGGLVLMLKALKSAPEGYEDETGFHEVASDFRAPGLESQSEANETACHSLIPSLH
jgi:hypothetical protein